jgi:2-phosphoglycerate kinase
VDESAFGKFDSEVALLNHIRETLSSYDSSILSNFETLTSYESLRGESSEIPTIAVVLEGASATGKSLIALELMHDLTATRFISTDTIRQVLRGIVSEDQHPELFCHTYQAHIHRQAGPSDLDPLVRGFLAQCELISPHIETMTKRVIEEGAIGVIEGVHIQPGILQSLSPGVIEILVNPDYETHRAMFTSKHEIGKLTTVSDDKIVRSKEFEATRAIQEFMIENAQKSNVSIVGLTTYQDVYQEVSDLIISKVRDLLGSFEEGATK